MNIFDFYFPEWGWVAVNLVILTIILSKLLFKPVTKILNERQERIERSIAEARAIEDEKNEMASHRTEYTAQLDAQTIEQMKDGRTRAGREYDRIVNEAEEKAKLIIEAARDQAERENELIRNALKEEVIADTLQAVALFLSENLNSEGNERLIENFMKRGLKF